MMPLRPHKEGKPMARLRNSSRRRGRLVSRVGVGLLLVGCAAFGVYAMSGGDEEVARQEEAPAIPITPPPTKVETEEPQRITPILRSVTPTKPQGEAIVAGDEWDLSEEPDVAAEAAQLASAPANPQVDALLQPEQRPAAPTGDFLAEAKTLTDVGDVLGAREILNTALQSGTLDSAKLDEVKQRLRTLNRVIVFTPSTRYAADPFQGTHTVQPGDLLSKIALPLDVPYGLIARINGVRPDRIRVGQSLKTLKGPLFAEVSKSTFEMDVYLGNLPGRPGSVYLTSFPVGLGADSSTPTGIWEVTRGSKLVNPEWTNPRTNEVYGRDDPENPLGERWIGLTGVAGNALGQPSYGIHGTIEPETIGTNASMGCIRLGDEDVEMVYDMLSEGKSLVAVVE
jgi:LysM repeat protein